MEIFDFLTNKINQVIVNNAWEKTYIDIKYSANPKTHINTSVAIRLASINTDITTFEIAKIISDTISQMEQIDSVSIDKNGFIGFNLTNEFWCKHLTNIIEKNPEYIEPKLGQGQSVNIEYVSCNPTGPIHIGHARSAILGSALSNLLKCAGFDVIQEFYVNDFGNQMINVAKSVLIRYKNIALNTSENIPVELYQGEYLQDVANKLYQIYKNELIQQSVEEQLQKVKTYTLNYMMNQIKEDLNNLQIKYDLFFFESDLHKDDNMKSVLTKLEKKGLIYEGIPPELKTKTQNNIQKQKHLMFKSSEFADTEDRALTKSDGTYSYFGSEVAYVDNKISRNFNIYITILGADHIGYIKRLEAAFHALTTEKNQIQNIIKIVQLVKYIKQGNEVKMSKRSGNFETLQDIANCLPIDTIKFNMLNKRSETQISFDINKALEESKTNPIFYIQYAHVRCLSLYKKLIEKFPCIETNTNSDEINPTNITLEKEICLIVKLCEWNRVFKDCVKRYDPSLITNYLYSLSCYYHSLWDAKLPDGTPYKFIIENIDITSSRISLSKATQIIINKGLSILGIEAKKSMSHIKS